MPVREIAKQLLLFSVASVVTVLLMLLGSQRQVEAMQPDLPPTSVQFTPTGFVTTVSRNGTTYDAVSQNGLPNYSGSLKSVVESAASDLNSAGGGTISFEAGLFEFGFNEWFELDALTDIVFEGQGIDVTTIQNVADASTDTEVFDFGQPPSARITIRDMTVSAGGPPRSTSDAIDADGGNDFLIERVKITSSRGRGIIFDGKDAGNTADRNQIRDCVITGILSDGIEFLASSDNIVTGCDIANVPGHGIKINKSSSVADQPNKKSDNNQISGNTIINAGGDGIHVDSSDLNLITGNVISNSSFNGMRIRSNNSITCDDNVIDGNTSTDNGRYGLNIASSNCHDNVVGVNTFQGNGSGDINDTGTNTQYSCSSACTLTPVADSYVDASSPSQNFGNWTALRTDGSPIRNVFARFNAQVVGVVQSATLRIFAETSNSIGVDARGSDNTWEELTVTFDTQPSFGAVIGSSGPIAGGSWYSLDVTAWVSGNGPVSFAWTSTNTTATRFSSREGTNPPELIIITAMQPDLPIQAMFFYPWYPENWTQAPPPFSHYTPDVPAGCDDTHPPPPSNACYYDSEDNTTIDEQLRLAHKAHVEAFISSWWGQGHHTDAHLQQVMSQALIGPYPGMRFAIYYEQEGQGDPTVTELADDLSYLQAEFFGRPNYLRVDGKPVVFVFNNQDLDQAKGQDTNNRWADAQTQAGINAYVVLKVYPGFRDTTNQPESWHQYAPSTPYIDFADEGSINVSPGFWKQGEAMPRLVRDIDRFRSDIIRGRDANADWKLITSWNEWGEGTSVEPAGGSDDPATEPAFFEDYIQILCEEWTQAPLTSFDCDPCPAIEDCDGDSLGLGDVFGLFFRDSVEVFLGTLPLVACAATPAPDDEDPDAFGPDFDDSQDVDGSDVFLFAQRFGTQLGVPLPVGKLAYSLRFDIYPTDVSLNKIDGSDVFVLATYFGDSCP